MRSLIKMEISKYPADDFYGNRKTPSIQQQTRCAGSATHTSMKINLKRNAIYGHNNVNSKHMDGSNDFLMQNEQPGDCKKQGRKNKSIQNYISDLTTQIQNPKNQPDFGQTKFKVLKRIIEHYDIKTMQKKHYSKLIKTFGLQIEPAKTQRKQIKTQNRNRSFKIKSTTRGQSRLSSLKNRVQDKDDNQVALLQFSRQLKPKIKYTLIKQNNTLSQQITDRYVQKQKINVKKQTKKLNAFKFKSNQDIFVDKINKFREFLFILNCSNNLYRHMQLQNYSVSLKFYVGPGNNSNLIKSLLKKRFYFQETSLIQKANFIFTQIKVDQIFNLQESSKFQSLHKQNNIGKKKTQKLNYMIKSQLEYDLCRIISKQQTQIYIKRSYELNAKLNKLDFEERAQLYKKNINKQNYSESDRVHNHLPSNGLLGNKKGMFYCLRQYYKLKSKNVWDVIPLTFHITKGISDDGFKQFSNYYNQRKRNKLPNIWIMKPGEFSNRGNGISCSSKFQEIKKKVSKCHVSKNGHANTLILQIYISNPLLYNNRKFDIRAYMLVTCHNGKLKGYWYQQGYIRTSSYNFDLNELSDNDIHLTNDAIQKKSQAYGKYQPGNKLSYSQLQRYLDGLIPNGRDLNFYQNALPKMKSIAKDSLLSSFLFLDQKRKQNNFQIFGLDFMLDYNLKPWLIQINTNPCLQLSCSLLQRIIPQMIQNAFRMSLDTIFPPPDFVPYNFKYNIAENALHYNKFELIFDEDADGSEVKLLYEQNPNSISLISTLTQIQQDQEVYQEEGKICDYDL